MAHIRWFGDDFLERELVHPPQLVGPLVFRGAATILAGQPGVGKSLLATAIAKAVANGDPSLAGMPVTPGLVVIVDAENGEFLLHARAKMAGLPTDRVRIGIPDGFDLRSSEAVAELESFVTEHQAALVVLDSLPSLAPGLKENDAHEVTPVIDRVRRLAHSTGAGVLLLHHTRKSDDAYRGGTAIPGAAEVLALLRRDPNTTDRCHRVLDWSFERGGKMRLGPEPDPVHFRMVVQDDALRIESSDAPQATQEVSERRERLRLAAVAAVGEHGPMNQASLLVAIGTSKDDKTGRKALQDAEALHQLERLSDKRYALFSGTGTTGTTTTDHEAVVVSGSGARKGPTATTTTPPDTCLRCRETPAALGSTLCPSCKHAAMRYLALSPANPPGVLA